MATAYHFVLQDLCFKAQGDVGELTCYTRGTKIVTFLKAWLRDPATERQIAHRNRMRAAAHTWKALQPQTRANWERATKKLSLYINGYNLWVHYQMVPEGEAHVLTIQRQTGIQLLPPT